MPAPKFWTSSALIWSAVQHWSIRFEISASIRSAAGASDWSRVVWQVGHMICPSMYDSDVFGCVHAAAAGAASTIAATRAAAVRRITS